MTGTILFLDLARTTGWCEGRPGERPVSGTVRLADPKAPPAAVYSGLMRFLAARLGAFRYLRVAYEAPFDPRHMKTNFNTARLLLGLPAIVEGLAHETGHWGAIKEASVHDIRKHLLGARPAPGTAKEAVMNFLRGQGYTPADDNEADAIAGWHYACDTLPGRLLEPIPPPAGARVSA